eukprot:148341-Prymnesium_polylepis.1
MAALPQRSRAASSSKSIVLFVGSVIVLLRSLLRLLAAELFGLLVPLLALLVVAVEQLPAADAADVDEAVRAGEGRARLMTFSRHAHASAGAADLAVVLQLCRELDGVQSGLLRVGLDRRLVPLVVSPPARLCRFCRVGSHPVQACVGGWEGLTAWCLRRPLPSRAVPPRRPEWRHRPARLPRAQHADARHARRPAQVRRLLPQLSPRPSTASRTRGRS